MKGFVYILKSIKDNKKYIGSTIDLKRRFHEHNHGLVESTRNRKPFILAAYRKFDTIEMASMYEKKYKHSNGHLKRDIESGKFINNSGDWRSW